MEAYYMPAKKIDMIDMTEKELHTDCKYVILFNESETWQWACANDLHGEWHFGLFADAQENDFQRLINTGQKIC